MDVRPNCGAVILEICITAEQAARRGTYLSPSKESTGADRHEDTMSSLHVNHPGVDGTGSTSRAHGAVLVSRVSD